MIRRNGKISHALRPKELLIMCDLTIQTIMIPFAKVLGDAWVCGASISSKYILVAVLCRQGCSLEILQWRGILRFQWGGS